MRAELRLFKLTEVLDNASKGVSMSGDEKLLALLELRNNNVVPVWERSLDGELERFASWEFFSWYVLVLGVLKRAVGRF